MPSDVGPAHTVIPAPLKFDVDDAGTFVFRSGTTVVHAQAGLGSIVERFCSAVARRTGIRLAPIVGHGETGEPSLVLEIADDEEISGLPGPTGIWPAGDGPDDERHSITITDTRVVVRAAGPIGVARGLTTLLQVLATAPIGDAVGISVRCGRILDAPRYAWRGLSLDLSRADFTVGEIERVIDLLELYKLNVLHLHLTDDQSWRIPFGRGGSGSGFDDDGFYSAEDLQAIVRYATDRSITIVPEIDMPAHVAALLRLNPVLDSGRNNAEANPGVGDGRRDAWLDPALPATFALIEQVLIGVTDVFPGSYIHIGGDEPHGMPHAQYVAFVERTRWLVRSLGKKPLGWQESARAGLGPGDVIQYWRPDVEAITAASTPVIMSPLTHCYLDVPYREPSAHPSQAARQARVGLRSYPPKTVAESFDWEPTRAVDPGVHVAGVEAAIWAETVSCFDDLAFLLLPRLPGIAEKAWGPPMAVGWSEHRDRLARHGRVWRQDDLTYFSSTEVDWP